MKNILLLLLLTASTFTFAQSKVGTVNIDYILSKMPELPAVQADLKTYGESLDSGLKEKFTKYESLIAAYKTGEATFTPQQKTEKQNEIIALEQDMGKGRENASKLLGIRQDEKLRPLYKKIGEALQTVAETEKYTQIMEINELLVYVDEQYDVTLKVLKQLGIDFKAE